MTERGDKNPQLQFKSINAGLGFHPFSDGLPYAPVTPASRGQVVMPPRPVSGPDAPAGASVAGAVRVAPQIRQPVSPPLHQPARAQARVVTPPAAPQALKPDPWQGQAFGVLYLSKRVFSYGIDWVVSSLLCSSVLAFILMRQQLDPMQLISPAVLILAAFFISALNWALIVAQEVAFGTSVGKRLLGLRVDGDAWAVFMRGVFFVFSVILVGTGLFWSLFDRQRRCWHDLASGVQPTETARL